ncbi:MULTISPECIES: twitch domain-containing radical SAM protein [Microcystis]|nr:MULTISPECIES: twitch domain-containing radical SAM protein [Microcystis]TRT70312.1 MAG: twitch domain-containing radical SAM protein [Microcystis sp. M_OC_Ca_00000000_S217Cul]TRT92243.1 MAG: twitch domain-containing radical SAM protein [Microcystis sp. M_OC_Ca_00000000_C217Col]
MLPKTFCILPFCQAMITNDGKVKLCSLNHGTNLVSEGRILSLHQSSLEDIWNSEYFRQLRRQMLAGEKIASCAKCYALEAEGSTSIRQVMNRYPSQRIPVAGEEQIMEWAAAIVDERGGQAPPPSALHLWLGNLCNLKCRMCSPMFSSQIAGDPVQAQWFDDRPRSETLLPVYLKGVEYTGFGELNKQGEKLTRPVISQKVTISLTAKGEPVDFIEISGQKQSKQLYHLLVMTEDQLLGQQLLAGSGEWRVVVKPDLVWNPSSRLEFSLHFLPVFYLPPLTSTRTAKLNIYRWGSPLGIDIDNLRIVSKPQSGKRQPKEFLSRIPENPHWSSNEKLVFEEILAHPESLQHINFTGGEPFIQPAFATILKKLIETDHAQHISLYINTNGTVYNRRLSEMLRQFLSVELAFSVEGVGQLQEYIRTPSRWEMISRNILSFQKDHIPLSVRPTAQAYNIFGILELVRWCQEQGLRYILNNLIWEPRFLSLDMLPQLVIDEARQDWQQYLEQECDEDNRWHIETIIAALQRPRPEPRELAVLQDAFIRYTNDIDRSRGQSLAVACPRLYDRLIAAGCDFGSKYRFSQPKMTDASIVITTCEVNQHHGTGALVKKIVADTANILSIRSVDLYGGEQDLGAIALCLSNPGLSRPEAVKNTVHAVRIFHEYKVTRLLCVPYLAEDLITAIVLQDLYQVPLAAYIMDDQNICVNNIPDQLMGEFLGKCSLRLVTHPELRAAYEAKYQLEFSLLPALVSEQLISPTPQLANLNSRSANVGALIGSISSQQCFDLLCNTIKAAGIELDWYNGTVDWYQDNQYRQQEEHSELIKNRGIHLCGLLPEEKLVQILRNYAYLVLPTGALAEGDHNPRLWRMIFAVATANIPIIVLGQETTSAAQFIRRFHLGVVCDYQGESLRQALEQLRDPKNCQQMRQNAAAIASKLSAKGINQWLWESIDQGKPRDGRFEELFADNLEQEEINSQESPLCQEPMTSEEILAHCFPQRLAHGYDGHLVDINNIDYIDMVSGWGSNILGHGYQRVARAVAEQMFKYSNLGMVGPEWQNLYELLTRLIPCAETMHLVKNGSDATAAAVRLARSVTGRVKVLHRGYHGVQDWYMASIQCPGVPSSHYGQIISLDVLEVEGVQRAFVEHPGEIACLIIDPMAWPIPDRETMLTIQAIVQKEGALLIFDEVVSGFRVAIGGAQEFWGIVPDLACYGKAIANGLPLSVLVGREQWLQQMSSINYGLTFSLEAVSIVAAIKTINEISDRQVCQDLAAKGRILKTAYGEICRTRGIESALVGHDCRPELKFWEINGFSGDYCRNLMNYELARQKVCTYGTFNLCYRHTQDDIQMVICALEKALARVALTLKG